MASSGRDIRDSRLRRVLLLGGVGSRWIGVNIKDEVDEEDEEEVVMVVFVEEGARVACIMGE